VRFADTNDPGNTILFLKNAMGEIEGLQFNYGSQRFEAVKQ